MDSSVQVHPGKSGLQSPAHPAAFPVFWLPVLPFFLSSIRWNRAAFQKEPISLPEGQASDLAKKLNQTSRILEKQNQTLHQRDTARTNWISGVSHDIRTLFL